MVPCVSQIMGKNKTFPLNQKLTLTNHGIYVATCVICHEQYVGQTKNKFSMRWSSHRRNWNRPNCEFDENNKDKAALLRHFSESHGDVSKPPIHEAYTVTFVEESNSPSLDFCEDKWHDRLHAQINIQNMTRNIIILFPWRWTLMNFILRDRFVSLFAASVQVFLFASGFASCPQRLGCHNDQNARWLIHNDCCFKPTSEASLCEESLLSESDFCFGVNR